MNISVVIPNWNGEDFLAACIDSLLKQSQACEIVVVENGSVDSSDEILAGYGDKITVLKQEKNLGFAGGVNVGIRYAIEHGHDYVALFNNDAVADEGWLKELLRVISVDEKCAIVTPKMLKLDKKTIDTLGTSYSIFGAPFPRHRNEPDTDKLQESEIVFGGAGGASLYRVALFKDIGLFDEDFFAYYEEDDINFRSLLAGNNAKTAPKALVYHAIGGTTVKMKGFTVQQTAKNFWFVYLKNMPGVLFWKYLPLASFWYFMMFVNRTRRGNFKFFIKGCFASLKFLPKNLKKRRHIQSTKVVSSKEVDSLLYHAIPPKNLRQKVSS